MGINFGSDKIKEIYYGSDKIKEVYHGEDLVWRAKPPVEPLILFEENSINVGFEQGYKEGGGSTNIFPESLFVSTAGDGVNTIVSTNKIDTTGYKTLKVTFSNTGTKKYTWCSLFPTKIENPMLYGYEGLPAASGVIELRVDWFIEGECYVAVGSLCDTVGMSSIATITKIELI